MQQSKHKVKIKSISIVPMGKIAALVGFEWPILNGGSFLGEEGSKEATQGMECVYVC